MAVRWAVYLKQRRRIRIRETQIQIGKVGFLQQGKIRCSSAISRNPKVYVNFVIIYLIQLEFVNYKSVRLIMKSILPYLSLSNKTNPKSRKLRKWIMENKFPIDDSADLNAWDKWARSRRLKWDEDIEMVVIDYLQLIKIRQAVERVIWRYPMKLYLTHK